MAMVYDEIFERPISEYSDDEIREIALSHRSKAKLTKAKRKASTSAKASNHSKKKSKAELMLKEAMNNAKLVSENKPTDKG